MNIQLAIAIIGLIGTTFALAAAVLNYHTARIKDDPTAKTPISLVAGAWSDLREVVRATWPALLIAQVLYYLAGRILVSTWSTPEFRLLAAILFVSHGAATGYYWPARVIARREALGVARLLLREFREGLIENKKDQPES